MRRVLKWTIGILLVLIGTALLFRGPLFRAFFHFDHLAARPSTKADPGNVPRGSAAASHTPEDLDACIDAALDSTADRLMFTIESAPSDALDALRTGSANCVGYSAVFKHLCEAQLSHVGLSGDWRVVHMRGLLYCGTFNVHSLFSSPFWKDHDICAVENRRTGQRVYVDATLFDVARIARVRGPVN